MKRRYGFGIAILLLLAVAITAMVALPQTEQIVDSEFIYKTATEFKIVIPAGTNERIQQGESIKLIHGDIELTLGGRDRLTFTNEDSVGHTISLFYVAPGQTISQQFTRPEIYEGTCSFQGGNIRIVVKEGS